jgi:hypothetical protein
MKKSKITIELLPVPQGFRIRYQHFYTQDVKRTRVWKGQEMELKPPVLRATGAWLVDSSGEEVPNSYVTSAVHPRDVGVKKLGRMKAHNKCVKAYMKSHPG